MLIRTILILLLFCSPALAAPYAKVVDGQIVTIENKQDPDTAFDGDGNPIWRPVIDEARPSHDPSTQVVEKDIRIEPSQVVRGWIVRNLSQEELDQRAAEIEQQKVGRLNVFVKILCRFENHDRQSDGKQPLTLQQCQDALKDLVNR